MNVTVIGAGTMGNGIAHVFAQSGHAVTLVDLDQSRLDAALGTIDKNLGRQVKKELLTEEQKGATLDRITPQTDLAEDAVVVHRDEPDIRPLRNTFIGVVARGDHSATSTLRRSPHGTTVERCLGDQPLPLAPAIEAIKAGDGPVPACRRDPLTSIAAPTRTMISLDIVAGRSPYGLAASIEKAKPDCHIIGLGAKRMPRSNPR